MGNDKSKEMINISDEQLVLSAQSGNASAFTEIIKRFIPLVNSRASSYFSEGLDPEDLAQEGMIGLLRAVRCYSKEKGASFKTFALLCVNRSIISAVRHSLSCAKIPASTLLSINSEKDSNLLSVEETIDANVRNPEDIVISADNTNTIYDNFGKYLSKLEYKVFVLYLIGCSYDVIAQKLSLDRKSVDNALCRAKDKLKKVIEDLF